MRLPKYSNPHFAADATRTVSRKTLQLQDDADDGGERSGEVDNVGLDEQEVEDLHVKLGEIVSKRIKLKRALAPSDEPHSKKRRKILAEEGDGNRTELEPVVFRLVSNSLPPRALHLTPKPPKVIPVKEPPCEDTEQELKERVRRSALSAVDLGQIKHTFPVVNDGKSLRLLRATSQSQEITSPLLLLEISPAAPHPPPWINQRLNVPPKPSPHQLPISSACCPIVSMDLPNHHDRRGKKGKRRRGKPKNKNKLVLR